MLAHWWTSLMWPPLVRRSWTSEGTDVTCTHTHTHKQQQCRCRFKQHWKKKRQCHVQHVHLCSDDGEIQRRRWRVEHVVCEYTHSSCGCLVPFPMNCINPYADWEKPVLFPISSWLTAVYLWVCRDRPTGASDSHTHAQIHTHTRTRTHARTHAHTHTHTQGTSFCYIENTLRRLSKESAVFL